MSPRKVEVRTQTSQTEGWPRGLIEMAPICKPRREASEGANPAYTLIWDLEPPEQCEEVHFCGLSCLAYDSVTEALTS